MSPHRALLDLVNANKLKSWKVPAMLQTSLGEIFSKGLIMLILYLEQLLLISCPTLKHRILKDKKQLVAMER